MCFVQLRFGCLAVIAYRDKKVVSIDILFFVRRFIRQLSHQAVVWTLK
jgi:hypothetical protein